MNRKSRSIINMLKLRGYLPLTGVAADRAVMLDPRTTPEKAELIRARYDK